MDHDSTEQSLSKSMSLSSSNYTPRDIEHELEALYPMVYRSVTAMTWGSGLDAEDITQDVFLKAYRSASKFNQDSSLSTWIYRITRNTVIDALRKKKLRSIFMGFWQDSEDGGYEPEQPDSNSDTYENQETINLVRLAIASLPEQYRTIIVWREIEDLPYSHIAEITGESEGTLKSRLFYAKKRLRDALIAKGLQYEIE
jgi:RNA polymerase sigma factor (sigma-70 family)